MALAEQHIDEGLAMAQRLLDASAQVPLEEMPLDGILHGFLTAMIALHRHRPRLHQMLLVEAPQPAGFLEALSTREDALAAELRGVLDRHPEVQLPDPDLGVYLLIHVAEGLVHDYMVHPPPARLPPPVCRSPA